MQRYEPWVGAGSKISTREAQGKVSPESGRSKRHWHPLDRRPPPNNEQIPNKLVLFKAEPGVCMLLSSSRILSMMSQILVQTRSSGPGTVLDGAKAEMPWS